MLASCFMFGLDTISSYPGAAAAPAGAEPVMMDRAVAAVATSASDARRRQPRCGVNLTAGIPSL